MPLLQPYLVPSMMLCDLQSLGYAGYPVVEVLRMAPAPDEAIMRGGRSIPVHGADGGLAFGPTPDPQDRQVVFDATFYRPVNTSFTGSLPLPGCCSLCLRTKGT